VPRLPITQSVSNLAQETHGRVRANLSLRNDKRFPALQ